MDAVISCQRQLNAVCELAVSCRPLKRLLGWLAQREYPDDWVNIISMLGFAFELNDARQLASADVQDLYDQMVYGLDLLAAPELNYLEIKESMYLGQQQMFLRLSANGQRELQSIIDRSDREQVS